MHPTPSCPLPEPRPPRVDPIRPADRPTRLFTPGK